MNTTRYIIAIAAAALMLAGCQKNDIGTVYAVGDSIVRFAPSVSDGGADANTKGELYNETGDPESLGKYVDEFMVAAWNIPSPGDPAQIIPDNTAKAFTGGYVSDNQQYQKVMKRDGAGGTKYWMTVQPQTEKAFKTTLPDADDEYIWKSGEVKTFYAYANLPESGATVTNTASGQTLQYTVPATATAQKDILLGFYSGGGNTGTAQICFRHPLTAIVFKRGGENLSGDLVNIKRIRLSGIAASGTVRMEADGTLSTWEVSDYSGAASLGDGSTDLSVDGTTGIIGGTDGVFLIIPQNTAEHNITVTVTATTLDGPCTFTTTISSTNLEMGKTNTFVFYPHATRWLEIEYRNPWPTEETF